MTRFLATLALIVSSFGMGMNAAPVVEATASDCHGYIATDGGWNVRCNNGYPTDQFAAFVTCRNPLFGTLMSNWGPYKTVASRERSQAYCPYGQTMIYKTIVKRS